MISLLQRLARSISFRWARLQYHPTIILLRRLLPRPRQARQTPLCKVAELDDLFRPDFLRAYKSILAWQSQETARIRIRPDCCPPHAYESLQRAYRRRVSHGGRPGRSRVLEFEMVWETVWPVMHLDLQPGMRVADVGTENSCLPPYLAALGCEAHGLDMFLGGYGEYFREQVLARCRDGRLLLDVAGDQGRAPSQAVYMQQDATAMTFGDCFFDRILCISTLEHIPDDGAAARELARVLKPGGLLAITVPFGPEYSQASDQPHRKGPNGTWAGDLNRIYSRDALFARVVEPSGLNVVGECDLSLEGRRLPGQAHDAASAAVFLRK